MNALTPIHCPGCGAPVPLVDQAATQCAYCRGPVTVPPQYLQAVAMRRDTVAARRAAEPLWARLAAGSSPRWRQIGGAVMALLPPVLTGIGAQLDPPLGTASLFALCTLPGLAPGAAIFVWGASADVTRRAACAALYASPPPSPGAPPGCRHCGAPLAVEPGALACTCLYCGTDSLVKEIPVGALAAARETAVASLREAATKLRLRLWGVRLALLGIAIFVVALGVALHAAQLRLQG